LSQINASAWTGALDATRIEEANKMRRPVLAVARAATNVTALAQREPAARLGSADLTILPAT
jgi:hypothetical protein